jgi:hypothetical protein
MFEYRVYVTNTSATQFSRLLTTFSWAHATEIAWADFVPADFVRVIALVNGIS